MLHGEYSPNDKRPLTNITSSGNLQRPPKAMRPRSHMPTGAFGRHDGIRILLTLSRSFTVKFDTILTRQSLRLPFLRIVHKYREDLHSSGSSSLNFRTFHTAPASPSLAPLRFARSARCCAPRPRGGVSLPSGASSPLGSVGR